MLWGVPLWTQNRICIAKCVLGCCSLKQYFILNNYLLQGKLPTFLVIFFNLYIFQYWSGKTFWLVSNLLYYALPKVRNAMSGDIKLCPASLADIIVRSYSVFGVSPVSWIVVLSVVFCSYINVWYYYFMLKIYIYSCVVAWYSLKQDNTRQHSAV